MSASKKDRIRRLELMYATISSATAEKNGKVYSGTLPELFKNVDVSKNTISRFLWAVSHCTKSLPNVLFDVTRIPYGLQIKRNRSGFIKNGVKIYGNDLIPFIMGAMDEYKPKPRKPREQKDSLKIYDYTEKLNLKTMSDDELSHLQYEIQKELEYRAQIHEKQARLQQVLDLAEMSIDELKDLLAL